MPNIPLDSTGDPFDFPENVPRDYRSLLGGLLVEMRGIRRELHDMKRTYSRDSEDHEIRLRSLEKFQWKSTGIAIVVSTIVSALIAAALRVAIHP